MNLSQLRIFYQLGLISLLNISLFILYTVLVKAMSLPEVLVRIIQGRALAPKDTDGALFLTAAPRPPPLRRRRLSVPGSVANCSASSSPLGSLCRNPISYLIIYLVFLWYGTHFFAFLR